MTRLCPFLVATLVSGLAGCAARHATKVEPQPHFVLEQAWHADGTWYYPHESFDYDQTGLASVYPDAHPPLTTDGEAFDQGAMAAASQTLQLPSVVRVTNLENGREILVRVNDRGPPVPARMIELTRRAAELLGVPPNGIGEVRVRVEEAPSRQLSEALQGPGGKLQIAAAPRAPVQAESLAPPQGVAQSPRGPALVHVVSASATQQTPPVPLRLPEMVTQTPPQPGRIWIRGSEFGRMEYAVRQQAELSGLNPQIERVREGRSEIYRLRAGPFTSIAAADAALDQARMRGVTDARITVE